MGLGDGTKTARTTPVQVKGLVGVRSIVTADKHVYAIADAGGGWFKSFSKTYAPSISGTAAVGNVLTFKAPKAWSPKASFGTVTWLRDGVATGETGSFHVVTAADIGHTFQVRVTGSKDGYADVTVTSKATAAVKAGSMAQGSVGVVGVARVGQVLTAYAPDWPAAAACQLGWQLSHKEKSGKKTVTVVDVTASGASYTLRPADRGRTVQAKVSCTLNGYTPVTKLSKGYTVGYGLLMSDAPMVSGTLTPGSQVRLDPGSAASFGQDVGYSPTRTFQWYVNGKAVKDAINYSMTVPDGAKDVYAKITMTADGYASLAYSSPKVGAAAPAAVPAGTVSAVGVAKAGQTLRVYLTGWQAGVSCQPGWQLSHTEKQGKKTVTVVDKTVAGATYTLLPEDVGRKVQATATCSRSGQTTTKKLSSAVSVTAGVLVAPKPVISGKPSVGQGLSLAAGLVTAPGAVVSVTRTIQWYVNGKAVSGETGTAFNVPTGAKDVLVKVSRTAPGRTSVVKSSAKIKIYA